MAGTTRSRPRIAPFVAALHDPQHLAQAALKVLAEINVQVVLKVIRNLTQFQDQGQDDGLLIGLLPQGFADLLRAPVRLVGAFRHHDAENRGLLDRFLDFGGKRMTGRHLPLIPPHLHVALDQAETELVDELLILVAVADED